MVLAFLWSAAKARANLLRHGVSFVEAIDVVRDPLARVIDDPIHSSDERRYIAFGVSRRHRLLTVIYTVRGGSIRLITARRSTTRERIAYEEESR